MKIWFVKLSSLFKIKFFRYTGAIKANLNSQTKLVIILDANIKNKLKLNTIYLFTLC